MKRAQRDFASHEGDFHLNNSEPPTKRPVRPPLIELLFLRFSLQYFITLDFLSPDPCLEASRLARRIRLDECRLRQSSNRGQQTPRRQRTG